MSVTRAQLLASGAYDQAPTDQDLELDVGDYRLVLDHGRVSWSHHGPTEDVHSSGVFTVRGELLTLRFTAGHDAGDPPSIYRWSIYRGVLTLRKAPGKLAKYSVPNPTFAPWHRVGR